MCAKFHRQEKQLLERIDQAIARNFENEHFNSGALCREVNLSKMQVYRKIRQSTGRSTALYIRLKRLERGRQLLEETDWAITEIAYRVGFKDPNYFSRAFLQEFGLRPRELRKKG